jgi:phage terminase large subunit-like protein
MSPPHYSRAGRERIKRVVNFFSNVLRHPKPPFTGQPFVLAQWQIRDLIAPVFGTLNARGLRQYRTALWMMAKKNGKSNLSAGIALYLTFADGEQAGEICSAAGDRDQASITFDLAAAMVESSPILARRAEVIRSTKRIIDRKSGSVYRALSADAGTKHGYNWSGIIFDELHTQPNRELWDTLTTGTRSRKQPLCIAISTAGYDRNSICYEQYDYAKRVAAGKVEDPTFYSKIYEVPEEFDSFDERFWKAANPGLGTAEDIAAGRAFLDIQALRDDARKAREVPSYLNTFLRLSLNRWTSQESRWLPLEKWDACDAPVDLESLKGRPCFAGMDLSATTDLSSLVLLFPNDDGGFTVLPFFWIPQEGMLARSRRDRVDYEVWHRKGLIEATPGAVIDYGYIRAKVNDLAAEYEIRELAYDPYNATQLRIDLEGDGLNMIEIRQGFRTLSPATKELERLVLARKIRHGGHPVLRWNADNVTVISDPAGNIKPDKARSRERIDGISALINAVDVATRQLPPATPEVFVVSTTA